MEPRTPQEADFQASIADLGHDIQDPAGRGSQALFSVPTTSRLVSEIAEAVPGIAFLVRSSDGVLEYVSERFRDYTGLPLTSATGSGWRAIVHAQDLDELLTHVKAAAPDRAVACATARLRDREGVFRWHEIRAIPLRSDDGVERWFGVCNDIDDHRRDEAEHALREVATSALAGSLVVAEMFSAFVKALTVNFVDFCAVDVHVPGQPLRRIAVALSGELDLVPPQLATAGTAGEGFASEAEVVIYGWGARAALPLLEVDAAVVVPLRLGQERLGHVWFASSAPGVLDARGVAFAKELTRYAALAFDRARMFQTAKRADLLRDEFLAIVSHELRTPLSTILGWARLLRENPSDTIRLARGVEVIERNAVAQTRIVDDLLDASRAIDGKLRLETHDVSLSSLARDAVAALGPRLREKQITISDRIEETRACVDPERIRQVIWNLLTNAVNFTPAGGTIAVSVHKVGNRVEIEIADDGIGIDPVFLPFIFDRFRQADASATRKQSGLGLGLAIVRAIVEQHGGTVEAESEGLGRGTRMRMSLPIMDSGVTRDSAPPHSSSPATTDLLGVRVLVVDDERDARELTALLLTRHGARVVTAGGAAEAMEALTRHPGIDVIVSDVGMPGEDGCSLVRRARQAHPGLRAIALSAYAREEDTVRARAAGFEGYLIKPADPNLFVESVAKLAREAR